MRGNFRMAMAGVKGSKWRSLLTMLGVIIGIVSVVTVVGIGEGVQRQVAQQIDQFGKDLITILPGQPDPDKPVLGAATDTVMFAPRQAANLTLGDIKTIQEAPGVTVVAPLGVVAGVPRADGREFRDGIVLATSNQLPEALNQKIAYGGFWDTKDEEANFAVIGRSAAISLFDEKVPLGRSFTFRGETFMVRGVFEDFKQLPLSPTVAFDDGIFIPYKVAARLTGNGAAAYTILAKPHDVSKTQEVKQVITERLTASHGGLQDFAVLGREENLAANEDIYELLSTWILAVAVISLLIGGVGIMNIMLVSVTERMHEIGVRKAIGATNRQILGQFTLEATVLSVLGGLTGIVISLLVILLLNVYTDLKPVVSLEAMGIAVAVSLAIGIIFGTLPAIKAARKDPIEALRHE